MGRRSKAKAARAQSARLASIASLKSLQERRLQRALEETELRNLDEQTRADEDIKVEPPSSAEGVEEEAPGIKVEASFSTNHNHQSEEGDVADNSGEPKSLPSFCFVCVEPLTSEERTRKVSEAECMCLLSDMLELSRSQSHQHLQRIGEPGKWIGLCHPCLGLIKEVGRRKLVIAKMEEEIKSRQQQIVKKMKGARLSLWRNMGANGDDDDDDGEASKERRRVVQTVKQILSFVRGRQYLLLFSDDPPIAIFKTKLDYNNRMEQGRSGNRKIRTVGVVGHPVTDKPLRQPSVPKKKIITANPGNSKKIATLPVPLTIRRDANVRRREKTDKLEASKDDQEEEVPIFMNDEDEDDNPMEDITDPLALDDDDADSFLKSSSVSKKQVYYCGLCPDDQLIYTSEEQLQLHTNLVHRPRPAPSRIENRKKRQRKQNFSAAGLKEEKRFEETSIQKKPRRFMKTPPPPSNLVTTTSMRRTQPAEEEEQVKPNIDSRSEGDPQDEKATGGNQEKNEAQRAPKRVRVVRFQHECLYRPSSNVKNYNSICRLPFPERLALSSKGISGTKPKNSMGTWTVTDRGREEPTGAKYDCPHCPSVRNYGVNRFAQHLAIHQRRPFRCTICSALFPSDQEQMEEHWKQKHPDAKTEAGPLEKFKRMSLDPGEIWKCQGCASGFSKEDGRDAHELECPYSIRKKITQTASKLVLHPAIIHSCQICNKPFRNVEEWRLHRVLHHPDVDRLSCLLCELSFGEKTVEGVEIRHDLKMLSHVRQLHHHHGSQDNNAAPARNLPPGGRIHDECEECGLVFNFIGDISTHFRKVHGTSTSKGGKVVPCSVSSCGTRFANFVSMRKHVHLLHFRADVAVCDLCGVSFKRAESLVEHKLQKHGTLPEDIPIRSCHVEGCGYRTVRSSAILNHSRMAHGAARNHVCKTCGKGFADSGKLRVHEHIHQNKESRPYQCEVCGNSFAVRNYLYIHMRLSHQIRKFRAQTERGIQKRLPKPHPKIRTRLLKSQLQLRRNNLWNNNRLWREWGNKKLLQNRTWIDLPSPFVLIKTLNYFFFVKPRNFN